MSIPPKDGLEQRVSVGTQLAWHLHFPSCQCEQCPNQQSSGGNYTSHQASSHELYSADYGSSAEKSFSAIDSHPFVGGEFVWSGWDYLGEPTLLWDLPRSSYSGILDLAGFKKDRFFLYQSRWRPHLPFAHILPHWYRPDRVGVVTPVHVLSSADEAELFLNGISQGRLQRQEYEYSFRWIEIIYQPGELIIVTYKNGHEWATASRRTTGEPAQLQLTADRNEINADGVGLSFITVEVLDEQGDVVADANNSSLFSLSGNEKIVATDNGNQADMKLFPSMVRNAFGGLALVIV